MKVEEQFLTKSKFTKLIENTVADMKIPIWMQYYMFVARMILNQKM